VNSHVTPSIVSENTCQVPIERVGMLWLNHSTNNIVYVDTTILMHNIEDDDPPVQTSFRGRDHQSSWIQMWGKVFLFVAMGIMSLLAIINTTRNLEWHSGVHPNV
jgi:hypothetical protein